MIGLFLAKSIDRVIVIGTVVFVIMMFGGFWGSYAYLGAIAPIICWRLDDWLRVPAPDFVKDKPWAPAVAPAALSEPPVEDEPVADTPGSDLGSAPDAELPPAPAWSTRTTARS